MGTEKLFFKEALRSYDQLYGLIGYPLSHSFSKKYFTAKFAALGLAQTHAYDLFPLEHIEELPQLQEWYPNLVGLNVTIPYKQEVQPYLTQLDPAAEAVGAVNTIRLRGQEWMGFNTDIIGFDESVKTILEGRSQPTRALVLGTGGAAKAVVYVLRKRGMEVQLVSRTAGPDRITYAELAPDRIADYPLIVNTTPLGTAPRVDTCPDLPYEALGSDHALLDLVYNPAETEFMKRGEARGARVMNGLQMLEGQAEAAWKIWQAG
jgi:shikimate dehydrogenase